ncbi:hypothetical protein [Hydrogenovibrio halophilus]|uniref:hypothetical protein n=1 Tax=Hydrogenovibrio halophilus TaxID=373391 RepID=UPI0003A218EC|nr:hypothetical protein [Hydrogenovibrio halophilus]
MRFLSAFALLSSTLFLTACGGGDQNVRLQNAEPATTDAIQTITIARVTDIQSGPHISQAALNECELQTQFPELLTQKAAEKGITVQTTTDFDQTEKGYQLAARYDQIISEGNPFIGHRKFTQIHLTLYKDGDKLAEADLGRHSGGGMFAGYKSSCSVLGRTVEANAEDATLWLQTPVDKARMGNL